MIELVLWLAVGLVFLACVYLVAERLERAAVRYRRCRRCERLHFPDRRAVEAHLRMMAPQPPARRLLPVDAAERESAASAGPAGGHR